MPNVIGLRMTTTAAIIVLGCRIYPDGTASTMMKHRVQEAAKVYQSLSNDDKSHPWVIFTGYQPHGDDNKKTTEAKAMSSYNEEEGLIPADHTVLEEKAETTAGNAYWSRMIIDNLGIEEVHVVTNEFHVKRSKVIFEQLYPSETYKLYYHSAEQQLDDETQKRSSEREEKLMQQIDFDISEVVRKIKESPDGKPIMTLNSPIISDEVFNHGFTTRFGGVSTHETLSSLNLMFNPKRRDPLVNVVENRQRLAHACRYIPQGFHIAKCVHGTGVWVVGDEEPDSYDALVTNQVYVTLAAPGADCTILLFCDPINKVCGAAHSGWRGTLAKISHAVLDVMTKRFSCQIKNIYVAVGPSIGPCCFEVGEDVAEQFAGISKDVVVRKENAPKPFVDLHKTTRILLEEYGVKPENIDDNTSKIDGVEESQRVTQCTYCDQEKRFFSYRRDGAQYGTQIGFISAVASSKNKDPKGKCQVA